MTHLAVLTGDIVRSTRVGADRLDAAMAALARGADRLARLQGAPTRFTRARGDGWQMVLTDPRLSLRAVFLLAAELKAASDGLSTRISVATGSGSLPALPAGADLNAASGDAFTLSGRQLDAMPGGQTLAYAETAGEDAPARAAFALAQPLISRWTAAQARAVAAMLDRPPPTQTEAAAGLGIARQSLQDALASAGHPAIEAALDAMERNNRR